MVNNFHGSQSSGIPQHTQFQCNSVLLYADIKIGMVTMKNVMSFNSAVSQLIQLSAVAWIKVYQLRFIYSIWANEFYRSLL